MKNLNRLLCVFLTGILVLGGTLCAFPVPVTAAEAAATETGAETPADANAADSAAPADTNAADTAAPAAPADTNAAGTAAPAAPADTNAAGTAAPAASAEPASLPVMDSSSAPAPSWPQGPEVHSASAILIEAETGTILYGKAIHDRHYPASITKLMTALLTYEYLKMDEVVSFSNEAVFGIDRDSSNIGIDVGEELTVEQCLYGLLVASANEVAVALSEKVAGTQDNFAKMMNSRARSLGCVDTHFASASGLHDPEHYTSVYDMSLIAREFFSHESLAVISNTPSYHFKRAKRQPDDFWVYTLNQLVRGQYEYNGSILVGGKTGFTDEARQTLVTCAEKDGMRLICVVMQAETPEQYADTCTLLDFGFENFTVIPLSENEHRFSMASSGFFGSGNDVFGLNSDPFAVQGGRVAAVPKGVTFEDLTGTLVKTDASADAEDGETAESTETAYSAADGTSVPVMEEGQADNQTNGQAGAQSDAQAEAQASAQAGASDAEAPEEPLYEPTLDDDGNIIMGTLVYTYQGVRVGSVDVLFLRSAIKNTEEADPADTAAPVYGSRRHGIAGMFIDYFTGLFHRGNNGTLYVDVPSALIMVALVSLLLSVLITFFRFLIHLASERREKRRRRLRREAARRARAAESAGTGRRSGNVRSGARRRTARTGNARSRTEDTTDRRDRKSSGNNSVLLRFRKWAEDDD